jgi:hypothetical protein
MEFDRPLRGQLAECDRCPLKDLKLIPHIGRVYMDRDTYDNKTYFTNTLTTEMVSLEGTGYELHFDDEASCGLAVAIDEKNGESVFLEDVFGMKAYEDKDGNIILGSGEGVYFTRWLSCAGGTLTAK